MRCLRRPRAAALLVALLALACAGPEGPERSGSGPYRYENDRIGIRVELPRDWIGFSTHAEAPKPFRAYLSEEKDPDESPLMLGMRSNGHAFVRVLTERVPEGSDTLELFQATYASNAERVETQEAAYSFLADTVRWRYRASDDTNDFSYVESLTVRDGRLIRVSFWTLSSLASIYRDEFDEIAGDVSFRWETHWEQPWAGLERTLDPGPFADRVAAPEAEPEQSCEPTAPPLLWTIEKDAGALYLFGSLHFGRPEFYPLATPVEEAFAESGTLVVELTSGEISDATRELEEAALLADGVTLADRIDPALHARLADYLALQGIPMDSFERLEPWMVSASLMAAALIANGYLPEFGVDRHFMERAGDRAVFGLETREEQLAVLRGQDPGVQLTSTLDGLADLDSLAPAMAHAWRCGDARELEDLTLHATTPEEQAQLDVYFLERNRILADRLEPFLAGEGTIFVVVGAGHLLGAEGIPALLTERGHVVSRP